MNPYYTIVATALVMTIIFIALATASSDPPTAH